MDGITCMFSLTVQISQVKIIFRLKGVFLVVVFDGNIVISVISASLIITYCMKYLPLIPPTVSSWKVL